MLGKSHKILFLTGTRADYGKMKPLMRITENDNDFDVCIFVTGMHMMMKYGYTCNEIEYDGYNNMYKYINQIEYDSMDRILAKTIYGLSDYVHEIKPDVIVVHGDRVETLAGAIVGSMNNIITIHIEGGEVSGTIDELIRHAVTKLSHLHLVCNENAKKRLIQLGESRNAIHIIGSPDVDIMNSDQLPTIGEVIKKYEIPWASYAILIFHPVTTECDDLVRQMNVIIEQLLVSRYNYVVIYPNNDYGSQIILNKYKDVSGSNKFRFYPSMRFEYFLSLLKHSEFIIGNSSAGIREAPHFGVPAINLGTRQNNRVSCDGIIDSNIEPKEIENALNKIQSIARIKYSLFGNGESAIKFYNLIKSDDLYMHNKQKYFIDM